MLRSNMKLLVSSKAFLQLHSDERCKSQVLGGSSIKIQFPHRT